MDYVFLIISRILTATAVVKNTVEASIDVDGSAGSLCTLATSSDPLAKLEVPLIAA